MFALLLIGLVVSSAEAADPYRCWVEHSEWATPAPESTGWEASDIFLVPQTEGPTVKHFTVGPRGMTRTATAVVEVPYGYTESDKTQRLRPLGVRLILLLSREPVKEWWLSVDSAEAQVPFEAHWGTLTVTKRAALDNGHTLEVKLKCIQ